MVFEEKEIVLIKTTASKTEMIWALTDKSVGAYLIAFFEKQ